MAEQITQVAGTIPEAAHYSKTRRDERFVLVDQKNIEINSGDEYIAIDSMEAGFLQSVRIVVDNPYIQVLLQLDEYRNKDPDGQCPAEIIYNGNSDTANRSFKVLDGQGSSKGYVMEYKPNTPEEYKGRIRLVIRNSIKSSLTVYGLGLNYTSGGTLPSPAVPAHMAGGIFSHPAFEALSLGQIAKAMTKPVGVEGYSSNNVFSETAIMNDDIELGSDHPYEGIAGKPIFTKDISSDFVGEGARTMSSGTHDVIVSDGNAARYALKVIDEPEFFPGTSGTPSQMKIRITPFYASTNAGAGSYNKNDGFAAVPWHTISTVDRTTLMSAGPFGDTFPGTTTYTPFVGGTALDGTTLAAEKTWVGKRFFFRRGGNIYFPGVIKTITKRHAPNTITESTNYWHDTNGYVAYKFNGSNVQKAVGVYPASDFGSSSKINIVTAPIPEYDDVRLGTVPQGGLGITVGDSTTVALDCNDSNEGLTGGFAAAAYEVSHVPCIPWVYEITFEPGVTTSPIDFPVVLPDGVDYPANPGLSAIPASIVSTGKYTGTFLDGATPANITKLKGIYEASETNCWGSVTSQADTNPKALIKSIEIKRNKTVSFEG
jgi:hypothetical protein